ncbi:MAG: DUF3592 domain-containing protein [Lagierella massiliensis]|nr:DUF3592 domain-containing protein [Lagierella massiliensis]
MVFLLYFFYFFTLSFVIVLTVLSYFLGYKPMKKEERCNKKTIGIVKGLSNYWYGDIRILSIEYYVDGISYKVVGPKFKYYFTKNLSGFFNSGTTNFSTNLNSKDNLPENLIINSSNNSFVKVTKSPLLKLFPIGSKVDVYYNPKNPKDAYAIRYVKPPKWTSYFLYFVTAFTLLVNIIILIFALTYSIQ